MSSVLKNISKHVKNSKKQKAVTKKAAPVAMQKLSDSSSERSVRPINDESLGVSAQVVSEPLNLVPILVLGFVGYYFLKGKIK